MKKSPKIKDIVNAVRESRKQTITAQALFSIVARAEGYKLMPRNAAETFKAVSETVRTLVESGEISYQYAPDGGYYTVHHHTPQEVQGVEPNHRFNGDSLHLQAARIMSARIFTPNMTRVKIAREELEAGLVYSGGEWLNREEYERKLVVDAFEEATNDSLNEVKPFNELRAIQKWMIEQFEQDSSPRVFPVKNDDRGRFYYKGGFLSPHNGRFARWLYTHEDECTFDHRTSFVQMISLILGDDELGRQVGITSDAEGDFYQTLAKEAGLEIDRHGTDREAMKRAIMPASYGAGEKLSRARFEKVYADKGEEVNKALWEVVAKSLKIFAHLQAQTRNFAREFAEDGETPEWLTPSGFTAKKHYFVHRQVQVVFDVDESNSWYRPMTMKISVPTKLISTQSVKAENGQPGQKSVIVATMANLVQSLDASLMAHVIYNFHQATGEILYPIHDSYTVDKDRAEILQRVVRDSIRKIATSPELAEIRRMLHLPPVRVQTTDEVPEGRGRVLDLRWMNPLETE